MVVTVAMEKMPTGFCTMCTRMDGYCASVLTFKRSRIQLSIVCLYQTQVETLKNEYAL